MGAGLVEARAKGLDGGRAAGLIHDGAAGRGIASQAGAAVLALTAGEGRLEAALVAHVPADVVVAGRGPVLPQAHAERVQVVVVGEFAELLAQGAAAAGALGPADVRQQVLRPAFSQVRELNIRYLPYGELRQHREAIARFGVGIKPVEAIARMF